MSSDSADIQDFDLPRFLAEARFGPNSRVTVNSEGWDSLVLEVDEEWILRLPRRPEVLISMRKEHALLKELSEHVSFNIPHPAPMEQANGHWYMRYRRLPGRPFSSSDDPAPVARALRELHSFPVARAAELLQIHTPTVETVQREYRRLHERAVAQVRPRLTAHGGELLDHGFRLFFEDQENLDLVLVHRDLGQEHILMNDAGDSLLALIDFGDARFDDSAIDFVGIYITAGAQAVDRAVAAYGKNISITRVFSYYWMGSLHAVFHGIDHGCPDLIADGLEGLNKRLVQIVAPSQ